MASVAIYLIFKDWSSRKQQQNGRIVLAFKQTIHSPSSLARILRQFRVYKQLTLVSTRVPLQCLKISSSTKSMWGFFTSASLRLQITASLSLKSFWPVFLSIQSSICSPMMPILMMASQTVTLLMLLSLRHRTSACMTCQLGSLTNAPIQMQAEIRTFQNLSFNNSMSLPVSFLLVLWQMRESAQHAMLRLRLSGSHRHLVTQSMVSQASGRPIRPIELMAAYLIQGLGFCRHLVRDLMTSILIWDFYSSDYLLITSKSVNCRALLSGPLRVVSSCSKFYYLIASMRFKAAMKSLALRHKLSQQFSSSKQKADGSMLPSYWYRVPGMKLLPKVYSMTLILSSGSDLTLQGSTLTIGSMIFQFQKYWCMSWSRSFSPSGPDDRSTEATNPRSLQLLTIISCRMAINCGWLDTDQFSLFRIDRRISFYLPLVLALLRSSTRAGMSSQVSTWSLRDRWSSMSTGISLKSSLARLTSTSSPRYPTLLRQPKPRPNSSRPSSISSTSQPATPSSQTPHTANSSTMQHRWACVALAPSPTSRSPTRAATSPSTPSSTTLLKQYNISNRATQVPTPISCSSSKYCNFYS